MNDENVVPVVIPEQDANISNMPGPSILKKGKAGEVEERSTCERLEKEGRFFLEISPPPPPPPLLGGRREGWKGLLVGWETKSRINYFS